MEWLPWKGYEGTPILLSFHRCGCDNITSSHTSSDITSQPDTGLGRLKHAYICHSLKIHHAVEFSCPFTMFSHRWLNHLQSHPEVINLQVASEKFPLLTIDFQTTAIISPRANGYFDGCTL